MKNVLLLAISLLLLGGCNKDNDSNPEFDTDAPNVETFVYLVKTNKYGEVTSESSSWLHMPNFTEEHIPQLLEYAKDMSHIKNFPANPISSSTPQSYGKDYLILGECLLWIVEGIRLDDSLSFGPYGSLVPYLIKSTGPEYTDYELLTTKEIAEVRERYIIWWKDYNDPSLSYVHAPLEDTNYRWR